MRFFFHLHECGIVSRDEEGMQRNDLASARGEAIRAARAVMCAEVEQGRLCMACKIVIEDEHGTEVMVLPFTEALSVSGLGVPAC